MNELIKLKFQVNKGIRIFFLPKEIHRIFQFWKNIFPI